MSIKVYFQYDGEPTDAEIVGGALAREAYKVKITIPEKWMAGPCSQLLTFFVSTYNKKFPEKLLAAENLFLKVGGIMLPLVEEVQRHVREYNDILILHQVVDKTLASRPAGSILCTNYGCGKYFLEEQNGDEACFHHKQAPVFHDTHKCWSCCPAQKALDWEQFEAIPTCMNGRHATANKAVSFKSEPVTSVALTDAQKTAMAGGAGTTVTYPDGPKRSGPRLFEGAEASGGPQQIVDGKANCRNFGCQKQFVVADNNDTACSYHAEGPVFWDTYKYWKCCPDKKKAEFEDFVAIPGCAVGPHKL